MIEGVRNEVRARVPELGVGSGPAVVQIGGTNWHGGRVHFAVLGPDGSPALFARVMRNRADDERLAREHEMLVRLAAHPDLTAHVTQPLFTAEVDGRTILCERAAPGRPMRVPHRPWRGSSPEEFANDLDTATAIAIRLAAATETFCNAERFDRDVLEPLRRFWHDAGGSKREGERVSEEAHAAFGGRPRTVTVHGDFIAKNLLVDDRGGCVLIDWETVEPQGLPLLDLMYFVTRYAYRGALGRGRKTDAVRAFYARTSRAAATARTMLEAYCNALELPLDLLAPVYRLHFLYKARLKARTTSLDNPVTRAWLELFADSLQNRRGPFDARTRWGRSGAPRRARRVPRERRE